MFAEPQPRSRPCAPLWITSARRAEVSSLSDPGVTRSLGWQFAALGFPLSSVQKPSAVPGVCCCATLQPKRGLDLQSSSDPASLGPVGPGTRRLCWPFLVLSALQVTPFPWSSSSLLRLGLVGGHTHSTQGFKVNPNYSKPNMVILSSLSMIGFEVGSWYNCSQ